jgi:hypothetical protein
MNRNTGAARRPHRWAAATMAWVVLTGLVAVPAGLFGAPTAQATEILSPTSAGLPRVTVTLSTEASMAQDVTYLVEFTMAVGARDGVWVKVNSGGPLLPTCGHITDLSSGASSDACASATAAGAARPSDVMTISTGSLSVGAGDAVAVEFEGVTNSGPVGLHSLTVWAAHSLSQLAGRLIGGAHYGLSKKSPLSGVSVSLSTHATGATEVTYGITFQTSKTGGLAPDGTITVQAAQGVVLPTCGHVTDLSTGANSDACAGGAAKPSSKMTISLGGTIAVGAGDAVWVEFDGVAQKQCPGTCSTLQPVTALRQPGLTAAGHAYSLEVSTSSDGPAIASYELVDQQRVADVYLQASRILGRSGANYAVTFQTSATGGLAPHGTITVSVPGAVLPTCGEVTDLITGVTADACAASGVQPGPKMTISTGSIAIAAGDDVDVQFTGVKPPGGLSHTITVSSSSDEPAEATFNNQISVEP